MRLGVSSVPYHRGFEIQILKRKVYGEQGFAARKITSIYSKIADRLDIVGTEVYAGFVDVYDTELLKRRKVQLHCFNEHRERVGDINFNPASKKRLDREYTDRLIDEAMRLGRKIKTKTMVIHPGFSYVKKGIVGLDDHLSRLGEIRDRAKDGGIDVLFENLPTDVPQIRYGDESFNPEMERYVMTSPEDIIEVSKIGGVCLDVGHANTVAAHNEDISLDDFFADEILSRTRKVHFVDNRGHEAHMAIGKGNIDWAMVCKAIKEYDCIAEGVVEVASPFGARSSVKKLKEYFNSKV